MGWNLEVIERCSEYWQNQEVNMPNHVILYWQNDNDNDMAYGKTKYKK